LSLCAYSAIGMVASTLVGIMSATLRSSIVCPPHFCQWFFLPLILHFSSPGGPPHHDAYPHAVFNHLSPQGVPIGDLTCPSSIIRFFRVYLGSQHYTFFLPPELNPALFRTFAMSPHHFAGPCQTSLSFFLIRVRWGGFLASLWFFPCFGKLSQGSGRVVAPPLVLSFPGRPEVPAFPRLP